MRPLLFAIATFIPTTLFADVLSFQDGDGGLYSTTDATYLSGVIGPDDNFGTNVELLAQFEPTNPFRSLIRFPNIFGALPGQIPVGSVIDSAVIRVKTSNPSTDLNTIHRLLVGWDESAVTWNNFGSTAGGQAGVDWEATVGGSFTPSVDETFFNIDITNIVGAWSGGQVNHGIVVNNPAIDGLGLHSDDAAVVTDRPMLTVNFTTVPEPSTLALCVAFACHFIFARRRALH